MGRQSAQLTQPVEPFGLDPALARLDRKTDVIRPRLQEGVDLVLALLPLQRTGGVDQHAAGPYQIGRVGEQPALEVGERSDIAGRLVPRDIRVATNGAGRRAWR